MTPAGSEHQAKLFFDDVDEAVAALIKMHGKEIGSNPGRPDRLCCNFTRDSNDFRGSSKKFVSVKSFEALSSNPTH